MRRWLLRSLGVIGALLVIQSIIWEYARMFPTYRVLVDPWSIRGFDTVHGSINVAIGLALLGAVALTTWSRATERIPRIGIVVYMTLAATIIALVWG